MRSDDALSVKSKKKTEKFFSRVGANKYATRRRVKWPNDRFFPISSWFCFLYFEILNTFDHSQGWLIL